jgi:pimeloyl-ACP methyl ester carboxylesterase
MSYLRRPDGCRIHYEVTGRRSAPPVLMIQGLGADKHGWDLQRLVFSLRYQVIALDNRGAGRSDKPHGEYSIPQMADDAVAVLDELGIDRAHVVGASMGGAIAQVAAVRHPDRVRSLSLVCTACRNQPWREELLLSWAEAATTQGLGSMTKQAARWVIGPRSFRRMVPLLGWLGPLGLGRPRHAFAAQVAAILAADDSLADGLADIAVPTIVIVGNQDILTPRGDSEELAERIPTAELVVISGAAHGLMIEHASTFNRVLGDFLGRAERAYQTRQAELTDVIDVPPGLLGGDRVTGGTEPAQISDPCAGLAAVSRR